MQDVAACVVVEGVDGDLVQDCQALGFAEGTEVLDGDDADVGRVVPLVGQFARARRLASEQDLEPDAPVAEIRETHDAVTADAQHLVDDGRRVVDLLQGLAEHHVVERLVRVVAYFSVQVALDNGQALPDAMGHALLVDFDARARDAFLGHERL